MEEEATNIGIHDYQIQVPRKENNEMMDEQVRLSRGIVTSVRTINSFLCLSMHACTSAYSSAIPCDQPLNYTT